MNGFQIITVLPDNFEWGDFEPMQADPKNKLPIIEKDKSGKYQGVRCVELSDELMQEYRDFQFRADYDPSECERWLRRARV